MKTSTAILALIGATDATYTASISIDEDALGSALGDAGQRIEQWANEHGDEMYPLAVSA